MDLLTLLVGPLWLVVGLVLGRLTRPPRRSTEPEYYCGCDHALAYHDPTTTACGNVDIRYVNSVQTEVECTCRRYVGPLPPAELDPDAVLRALRGGPIPEETP